MPDTGISSSQAVNYAEADGGMYFNAILPASASVGHETFNAYHASGSLNTPDDTGGPADTGAGYYIRPDYVLLTNAGNCHEIKFMMSGSRDDAFDSDTNGWVSFGSASYTGNGSGSSVVRLDISPLAWTGSGAANHGSCEGQGAAGSGSVVFVYSSTGRSI